MTELRKKIKIGDLFSYGSPKLVFQKCLSSESTAHTSDHEKVLKVNEMGFEILDEFKVDQNDLKFSELESTYLVDINNEFQCNGSHELMFPNESEIQSYVKMFLKDIIRLLCDRSKMFEECSLVNEKGAKHSRHRFDFWMLYVDGRPVTIVEVKSPLSDTPGEPDNGDILRDLSVLGQLYDYIMTIRLFHGAVDVFGVVTTLKHWRLLWLPSADDMALAAGVDSVPKVPLGPSEDPNARIVSASPVYSMDDHLLVPTLLSAIRKSQHTRYQAIPTLSNKRAYLLLCAESWRWHRPDTQEASLLEDHVTLEWRGHSANVELEFLVLKYLKLAPTCKVWLGIVSKNGCPNGELCVIKQVETIEAAVRERRLWSVANGSQEVLVQRVLRMDAVVMPFVLLATDKDGKVAFNFSPAHWISQPGVTVANLPQNLASHAAALHQCAQAKNMWDPRVVASLAIQRFSKGGMRHDDLEWRHVALIPEHHNGQLTGVSAGLIDLEYVTEGVPEELARADMERQLAKMYEGKLFPNPC